ncbi:MAG TPA: hypothetical protein VJT70_01945, partial [Sphingomicrobium sp.]|nr:hypothetical protein [Sphingomicrobium sp.]
MRNKLLLTASAAAVLALPAIAQQPAAPQPAPTAQTPAPAPATLPGPAPSDGPADESAVEEVSAINLPPPEPPVEYPGWARRDPWTVGSIAPEAAGVTAEAWGAANGPFLSTLMRRMRTPLAS